MDRSMDSDRLSYPLGKMDGMERDLTPEALDAWQRSMDEIDR